MGPSRLRCLLSRAFAPTKPSAVLWYDSCYFGSSRNSYVTVVNNGVTVCKLSPKPLFAAYILKGNLSILSIPAQKGSPFTYCHTFTFNSNKALEYIQAARLISPPALSLFISSSTNKKRASCQVKNKTEAFLKIKKLITMHFRMRTLHRCKIIAKRQ